jgi:hypothetical protein
MKKLFWILPVGLLSLGAGVGYFYWDRATTIPDWYAETGDEVATLPIASATSSPSALATPSSSSIASSPASSTGVSSLTVSSNLQVSATPKALPRGVQSIKTQVWENNIRSGALINLSEMDTTSPGRQSELVQKLLVVMPQLQGRKVFLGISGQLVEKNNQRQLSADSKLAIGKVEFSLDEVANRMSVQRGDLDRMILNYLQLNKPATSSPTPNPSKSS